MSQKKMSRRGFVKAASSIAAFSIIPGHILAAKSVRPSETVNIAVIGTGGQGIVNIKALLGLGNVKITAICDPNLESDYSKFYYKTDGGRGPAAKIINDHYGEKGLPYKVSQYTDFRKMFEKENKNIDAVVVATPDHNHAIASMAAIENGKHLYCEKPLAHSVYETRTVTNAARKAGIATQMGNHGHSGQGIRLTVEWIRDGAIGDVTEVQAWSGAGNWRLNGINRRPVDTPAVPKGLDWDLWLGCVKKRSYHPAYAPYNWRGWWDFGTGCIGDMACHNIDPAFWALDLKAPCTIEAYATEKSDEVIPNAVIYHYTFGARGKMPPVKMTWYSGGIMPPTPEELEPGRSLPKGNGVLFIGTKGKIMCPGWGGNPRIIPETKMREYHCPSQTIARVKGHHIDWINACMGKGQASGGFDYSGLLTETVLLGNAALRSGQKLCWDSENVKVTNCPEAEKYIKPQYYNGWKL